MRERLRQFSDFATLDPAALAAVAASSKRLRVPARRWLLRAGRRLSGRFYLLEGRVQLVEQGRPVIVAAGSARARRMIYPGAAAVETLTPAEFLRVLVPAPEHAADLPAGVPDLLAEECWQQRFLSSPLMQRLDPQIWQRVLRAMRRIRFAAGERLIRLGAGADCCYVLCSGSAEIRSADGRPLARLEPGSLFGEDALICGGVRNADVVACVAGTAMALEAERFRGWLLEEVVQPIGEIGARIAVDLGGGIGLRVAVPALRRVAPELDREVGYAITGGSVAERNLAAFLLAEHGLDARPLLPAGGVRPVPCGARPSA
ncbi:MAG TPA: cyclic nucleotide-binding domain-containing protein [Pseudomonadales bacterium]